MGTRESTSATADQFGVAEADIGEAPAPLTSGSAAGSPSAANLAAGLAGIGARAVASIGVAGRAALRPGAALAQTAWRTPTAAPARDRVGHALEVLDARGRRDAEQARARLVDASSVALIWILNGAGGSREAGRLMDRLVGSEEFRRAVEHVVQAQRQVGRGVAEEVAGEARRRTVGDSAERIARIVLRRPARRVDASNETPLPPGTPP
jgi:hypothetical protein